MVGASSVAVVLFFGVFGGPGGGRFEGTYNGIPCTCVTLGCIYRSQIKRDLKMPVRMAVIQKSTSNKCWRGCFEAFESFENALKALTFISP